MGSTQYDIKSRIESQLEQDDDYNSTLKVKLSADGRNIESNLKLFNFTFTLNNDLDKAKTSAGNYTLVISNLLEENLKSPFNYITVI
ncbi:hypothetical protein BpHYR1_034618 [Brachionus plicatilis]|uniref:Uncharacterized protein n=1 Tax=Brachionus plicatilis TaxID=10195 RepID=A0A3M7T0A6_BRAPC|nr:hypothetical protein BpHYR1_034618 [Brachionus plicatilis]